MSKVILLGGSISSAALATALLAEAAKGVDLMPLSPIVDTRKGPEQLTPAVQRRAEFDGMSMRMLKAENKRKRKAAKLIRDFKEN